MNMDTIAKAAAQVVVADLAENGGGTYEVGTLIPFKPDSGYAVGIGGARLPAAAFTTQVAYWLLKAVGTEYEANFVGTWLDGGTVYVDAVKYFVPVNRDRALLLGHELGQKAIFDFSTMEDITL